MIRLHQIKYVAFVYSCLATMLLFMSAAYATMSELSDFPRERSIRACRSWAGIQSDDVFDMWGVVESGNRRKDVALDRLTIYCRGGDLPDIVGALSSAGAMESYCKAHKLVAFCRSVLASLLPQLPYEGSWAPDDQQCKEPTDGTITIRGESYEGHEESCKNKNETNYRLIDKFVTTMLW